MTKKEEAMKISKFLLISTLVILTGIMALLYNPSQSEDLKKMFFPITEVSKSIESKEDLANEAVHEKIRTKNKIYGWLKASVSFKFGNKDGQNLIVFRLNPNL